MDPIVVSLAELERYLSNNPEQGRVSDDPCQICMNFEKAPTGARVYYIEMYSLPVCLDCLFEALVDNPKFLLPMMTWLKKNPKGH